MEDTTSQLKYYFTARMNKNDFLVLYFINWVSKLLFYIIFLKFKSTHKKCIWLGSELPATSPKSEHFNKPLLSLLASSKENINRPVQILIGQPNQTPYIWTAYLFPLLFKEHRLFHLRHIWQLFYTLLLGSRKKTESPSFMHMKNHSLRLGLAGYSGHTVKKDSKNDFCHAFFHISVFCPENPFNSCNVSLMVL